LAVEHVVQNLRSEMYLKASSLIVAGRSDEIASLADANPMQWMRQQPVNYLGEIYFLQGTKVSDGNWYYDKATHTLVYFYSKTTNFREGKLKQLKFKVKLVNNNRNAVGQSIFKIMPTANKRHFKR
jgi:hypothetical protein